MEKIKEFLSHNATEDSAHSATGTTSTSSNPHAGVDGLSGQGSHLAGSRDTSTTSGALHIPGAYETTPTVEKTGHNLGTDNTSEPVGTSHQQGTLPGSASSNTGSKSTSLSGTGVEQSSSTGLGNTPPSAAGHGLSSNTGSGSTSTFQSGLSSTQPKPGTVSEATTDQSGQPIGFGTGTGSGTGAAHATSTHREGSSEHHHGRDVAAMDAAGLEAGVSSHQQSGREQRAFPLNQPGQTSSTIGTSGMPSTTSSETTNQQPIHNSSLLGKANPPVDSAQAQYGSGQTSKPPAGYGAAPISSSTGTTTAHKYGHDADLGGAGAAGATSLAHEPNRHSNASTSPPTSSSQLPAHSSNLSDKAGPRADITQSAGVENSTSPSTNPTSSGTGTRSGTNPLTGNPSSDHHYGRDAAAAGSLGAGAYAATKHHDKHGQTGLPSTTRTTTSGPHSSLANKVNSGVDSDRNGPSRLGTTSQGYRAAPSGQNSAYYSSPKGSAVEGPHQTQTANLLDPQLNTGGGTTKLEDAHRHSKKHGGGDEAADKHHLGRGAAIGAGLAAPAIDMAKHEQKHSHSTSTGTSSLPLRGSTPNVPEASHSTGQPSHTDQGGPDPSGHHLGRDAAAGVGGIGLAEHEHNKHQLDASGSHTTPIYDRMATTRGTDTATSNHHYGKNAALGAGAVGGAELAAHGDGKYQGTSGNDPRVALPGPAPGTAGPHSQDWMNKLDPRVKAQGDGSNMSTSSNQHDSRTGKNIAGTGAGAGVGAIGAGAYELHKHGNQSTSDTYSSPATSTEKSLPVAPGNHGIGPETGSQTAVKREGQTSDDHHHGRDAATVGSAGALGASAYEAKKHHQSRTDEPNHSSTTGPVGTTATTATTAGPHSSVAANKVDPSIDSDRAKEHHSRRDAAGAGAVGTGAYEADKHHQKKELEKEQKQHAKDVEKDRKHAAKEHEKDQKKHEKEMAKEHQREEKEEKKEHKGLFSFLKRDKSKKYSPEEEAEFDRQEREHGNHGSRNAAAAAGAGAGAYGAHEHSKMHGTGLDEKEPGTDLGDHLHGVDRNRGVTHDHEGIQNTGIHNTSKDHHYGRDAASLGTAGALVEKQHKNHESASGQHLSTISGTGATSGQPGLSSSEASTDQDGNRLTGEDATDERQRTGNEHHYGRDAAVAGGVGGEHTKARGLNDLNDPEPPTYVHSGAGQTAHPRSLAQKTDPPTDMSTAPRSTGDFSYGTGTTHGPTGHPGTTHGAGYGENDRNRLHKDPPASHPAAGGVPSSSSETSKIIHEGKQGLKQDTGVGNSHSTNTAANY